MTQLQSVQTCPYCGSEVEEHLSIWEWDATEEVECHSCDKVYVVKPQFKFEGWLIEEQCKCGEWTDDGMKLCDCEDQP